MAVDFKMYLKDEIKSLKDQIIRLLGTLTDLSEQNLHTIMPGYTHLQHAQPITLAHHLMAYFEMFKRDVTRLEDCLRRMDESPRQLCPGRHHLPAGQELTADLLGFGACTQNSLDSVSDRDYAIEFLAPRPLL